MQITPPYLLFLGDAHDQLAAKTAAGVRHWRPEWCLGQHCLPGCNADVGLPAMDVEEAARAGARTVIVGVANRGGVISESWIDVLRRALDLGLDVAAGLHKRLGDVEVLRDTALRSGTRLFDVRHPDRDFPLATGRKREGLRLLTVGTDASVGKMFTSLAIEAALRRRGVAADFRATGQTGIFIAGGGVSVDAVIADFISGAVEWLTPDNDPAHWDLIEGQGSLFHASFAGVSLGLLHGAQPDALVLCHDPARTHMRGLPDFPPPDVNECIEANLRSARLTNPRVRCIGLSLNTSQLDSAAAEASLERLASETGLPAVDPLRGGVEPLVDRLLS